ncbi:MAG: phosphodiester glycosidase family protein [Verrucomicrobiota bacterium]
MPCLLTRRVFFPAFTAVLAGAVFFMPSPALRAAEGVEFSTVRSGGKAFTVCRADLARVKLQLFHRDGTGQPFNRFDRLEAWLQPQGRNLVFAMNAGMFHPGFEAVGLFVSDGKTLSPLNAADGKGNFFLKPNGVFAITDKGARVVETSEFSKLPGPVRLATQSGPLLVRGGKFHPAFNAGSVSRLIRNGVGVMSPEKVVFAISDEPVNFHEFATLFRDTLKCPDALFLDGTISSLFAPALKRRDSSHDLGPMIGITAP